MPTTPPPDVPATSGMPPHVADYLRRLSTWAYQELDKKVMKDEATPHVIFSASDQKPPTAAFMVTVNSAGTLSTNQVPLGSGKP